MFTPKLHSLLRIGSLRSIRSFVITNSIHKEVRSTTIVFVAYMYTHPLRNFIAWKMLAYFVFRLGGLQSPMCLDAGPTVGKYSPLCFRENSSEENWKRRIRGSQGTRAAKLKYTVHLNWTKPDVKWLIFELDSGLHALQLYSSSAPSSSSSFVFTHRSSTKHKI